MRFLLLARPHYQEHRKLFYKVTGSGSIAWMYLLHNFENNVVDRHSKDAKINSKEVDLLLVIGISR